MGIHCQRHFWHSTLAWLLRAVSLQLHDLLFSLTVISLAERPRHKSTQLKLILHTVKRAQAHRELCSRAARSPLSRRIKGRNVKPRRLSISFACFVLNRCTGQLPRGSKWHVWHDGTLERHMTLVPPYTRVGSRCRLKYRRAAKYASLQKDVFLFHFNG